MTRHQNGISALVTQTSFCEGSSDDLANRRLFSQARSLSVEERGLNDVGGNKMGSKKRDPKK